MTTQEANPAPDAEVVGQAFVEQYYHILHQSPALVHRFYQDSSSLSRPDATGTLTTVTTMKAIDEKILSQKYEDYSAQIESSDAQESFEKGVMVLVTGSLTGKDNVKKKFTQTFFLAPQDKGFFVLNDVFRFLEEQEEESSQLRSVPVDGVDEDSSIPSQIAEPEHVHDQCETEPVASIEAEASDDVVEVCASSDKEEISVVENKTIEPHTQASQSISLPGAESASQEDAPKKSYASIVKVMGSSPTTRVYTPKPRVSRVNTTQKPIASPAKSVAAPEASVPSNDNTLQSKDIIGEDEGHSIYVRNLPFDATTAELENVFKTFGPVKQEGIQIRSNKQGFCFGFVEFETLSGKQGALKAARITVGDRQAVVEEKKTNTRAGSNSGRGRYSSGRGSFRGDGFRGGRGGYDGGRGGYGRSEFRNQGEFPRRPRASNPRNSGEGYQRVNPAGIGGGHGGTGFEGSSY